MVSKTALSFALVPSPNSKRVSSSSPFFCWGKMVSKNDFRLRSYLLRILSVFHRRLLFSAGVKCLKIAPFFALVVTGTFSEFLACITVVSFFAGVKWSLKLHFRLRSYLIRILSLHYRRFLFLLG